MFGGKCEGATESWKCNGPFFSIYLTAFDISNGDNTDFHRLPNLSTPEGRIVGICSLLMYAGLSKLRNRHIKSLRWLIELFLSLCQHIAHSLELQRTTWWLRDNFTTPSLSCLGNLTPMHFPPQREHPLDVPYSSREMVHFFLYFLHRVFHFRTTPVKSNNLLRAFRAAKSGRL